MLFCQGMQRKWKFKQQKTTLDATAVNWQQENEATVHTGSTKLDNRRLEKHRVVSWYSYSQNINKQRIGFKCNLTITTGVNSTISSKC